MSKHCKIVDPEKPFSSDKSVDFNWQECIFCQKHTTEDLQCPANIRRSDVEVGLGYYSLETNLERCRSLNWFPADISVEHLDDGNGMAITLQKYEAKWHKTCRNKFSDLKIDRYEKRKRKEESEGTSGTTSKVTRQSVGSATATMVKACFFCGETSGASTFNIDRNGRKCAVDLQDTVLLAKLSVGDMISQEAVYHVKCLSSLYNKARRQKSVQESTNKRIHGIVLAEILAYIEESRADADARFRHCCLSL